VQPGPVEALVCLRYLAAKGCHLGYQCSQALTESRAEGSACGSAIVLLHRTSAPDGPLSGRAAAHNPGDRGMRQAERAADHRRRVPGCVGGRLAALGVKHTTEVSAAARSLQPPARGETRRGSQVAVPRQASRHRAGAVTRARQAAAKAARSATSKALAANSSANRRGYRRVVLRAPRHTVSLASTYWLSPSLADGGGGFGDLDGLPLSGLMVRYDIGVQDQPT
jgi:hypothetical protein